MKKLLFSFLFFLVSSPLFAQAKMGDSVRIAITDPTGQTCTSTDTVLYYNSNWFKCTAGVYASFGGGGGGGTPGGSNTQVQYNSSGAFAGSVNFIFDATNKRLGLGGTTTDFKLDLNGTAATADRKIGINGLQTLYLPDQTNFIGSFFVGNGGGSLSHTTGTQGQYNTGTGIGTLYNLTTGDTNTGTGGYALFNATSGSSNSAHGYNSLYNLTTGTYNSANGHSSLVSATTGGQNTAAGAFAGQALTTGSYNAIFGYQAGVQLVSGSNNVFLGSQSGAYERGSSKLHISSSAETFPLIGGDFSTKRVGIGLVNPGYKFQVNTSSSTTSAVATTNSTTTISTSSSLTASIAVGDAISVCTNSGSACDVRTVTAINSSTITVDSAITFTEAVAQPITYTKPSFRVDNSSGVTGMEVVSQAAGSGAILRVFGGNSNEDLWLTPKSSGTVKTARDFSIGANRGLILNGSSGTLTQYANTSTTSYGWIWPGAQGAANTVLLNDGSGNGSWATASTILDSIGSTRGSVLYRGASGWAVLSPGTSGYFLKSQGAGADPMWDTGSGGSGTVTTFSASVGPTSALFTTNVTNPTTTPALAMTLANAANDTWWGNISGGAATPTYNSAAALTKSDDTNVTLTLGGTPGTALLKAVSLTLGWTGTLAKARQNSATVYNDAANTYSTGLQDLSAATFKAPIAAGYAPTTSGLFGYDSTANLFKGGANGAAKTFLFTDGDGSSLTNLNASNLASGTVAAARGGAGTVSGILKANGSGVVSAAVSGTDYAPATSGSGVLKGNGSGGFSTATAGTDYTSPSSTETQTNKTVDAEGTGNTITIPVKYWLLAGACTNTTAASMWDLPTSAPAVATCVTGTNIQKGVLAFADTGGSLSAQNTLALPADFTGNIDVVLYWTTSATTGNCKWSVQTAFTATNATETDDPAFNTASTVTTAAPGTANRVQTSSITSVTSTGSGASKLFHIKVSRDGADGSDTIAAEARLIGVEVTLRRAM